MKKFLLLTAILFIVSFLKAQDCSDLFISEYDEGNYNNKALELYNPTDVPVDMSNYRLIRWTNGSTTSDQESDKTLFLAGTIAAHDVFVIILDRRDTTAIGQDTAVFAELQTYADTFCCTSYTVNNVMNFNGNDALSLQKNSGKTWTDIDIFGKIGEDPGESWTDDATAGYTDANGGPWWTKNHTLLRKSTIKQGIITNPPLFNVTLEWDSLSENTWTNLGAHDCECNPQSISEIKNTDNFSFYPNPVSDNNFYLKATSDINLIEISNISGQIIFYKNFKQKTKNINIKLNKFNTGVYLVKVTFTSKNTIIKKIIIN